MAKNEKKFYPLVSVIVPVYNGQDYIENAIKSVLNQSYKNIEIIVVNDGSTDNTEKILDKYKDKIIYHKQKNGGVSSALNKGISLMKGEYFSWLSHDDIYKEDKVQKQIDFLSKKDDKKIILFSNFEFINDKSQIFNKTLFHKIHKKSSLDNGVYPVINGCVNGCTIFIPREFLNDKTMFDENLRTSNDYDLWFRLFRKYPHEFMQDYLMKYRLHDEQDTKKNPVFIKESNELWINFLKELTTDELNLLAGSEFNAYMKIHTQMKHSQYKEAADYSYKKAKESYQKNDPLVSILMPCYNSEKYLSAAIESIINQDYFDFELLLIDDKSTDSTEQIMKEYAKKDFRIKTLKNINKKGVAGALNTGLSNVKGKYVTRLDSDDISLENRIRTQVEFLENNQDYSFCATNISFINEKGTITKENAYKKPDAPISFELVFTNPVPNATIMYSMDIIKENQLSFDDVKTAEDYGFLTNYILFGKGHFIYEQLYQYRILQSSLFHSNKEESLANSIIYCEKYYEKICDEKAPDIHKYFTDFSLDLDELSKKANLEIFKFLENILTKYSDYFHYDKSEYDKGYDYILNKYNQIIIHKYEQEINNIPVSIADENLSISENVEEVVVIETKNDKPSRYSNLKKEYYAKKEAFNYYLNTYGKRKTIAKIFSKIKNKLFKRKK